MTEAFSPGLEEVASAPLHRRREASEPWRCILIGSELLLLECARMLRERGHMIAAVASDHGAVHDWARAEAIPVAANPRGLLEMELPPVDFLFSITNLWIVPPELLRLPRRGAINFHDGPLPGYAGINAPIWALLNGEQRHAITWHKMTEVVDGGDVLATRAFPVDVEETGFSLNTKCFAAAIEAFDELLETLGSGGYTGQPQGGGPNRYHGLADRPATAATIDWSQPASTIARLVRALDHGNHANPLGLPKLMIGGEIYLVRKARLSDTSSGRAGGTVLGAVDDAILIATGDRDLRVEALSTLNGTPVDLSRFAEQYRGATCSFPSLELAAPLGELDSGASRHERWWRRRLAGRRPYLLPQIKRAARSAGVTDAVDYRHDMMAAGIERGAVLAALIAYLARIADKAEFDLGYSDPIFTERFAGVQAWFAGNVPFAVRLDFGSSFSALGETVMREIGELHRRVGYAADLIARSPEIAPGTESDFPVTLLIVDSLDDAASRPGADLTVAIRADGGASRWLFDPALLDRSAVEAMQQGFEALLTAGVAAPATALADLPLMDAATLEACREQWKGAGSVGHDEFCIHELFTRQALRTPDSPAVTCRGKTLSYGELDARSNRLARYLKMLGIGPDILVALHLERSVDLLVALIGIHKAGGAYVPLDPDYPAERIAYMVEDAGAPVIISQESLAGKLPPTDARIVLIDRDGPEFERESAEPFAGEALPHHLAYVIYTSGSTGRPKGVMVEHRNVANFFAGMDEKLEPGGAWLAVTSLSFDISVLELCWTLSRGYHVVLATGTELRGEDVSAKSIRQIDFSLFYFASAEGGSGRDAYRLLMEGARFADSHGFAAVWTPERHFHQFGGLYPNPSVTGAAIAAITERVKIRGGSVVLPLHHPARVAEEWSLVDNLSNGRVGIAFASGWQPNDFVLRPEAYANRTSGLVRDIEVVRGLWRGEKRTFPGPNGDNVPVAIYPQPVQRELPFWITSAGSSQTFAAAGTAGAFLLTHLLGQTTEELAEKIALYRRSWKEAGHPGEGQVTLMLHSFVTEDGTSVREAVREPLIDYLRSSTGLVKQHAWSFPAFKKPAGAVPGNDIDLDSLTAEEMDALLEHAFERYYETSGLFGTPESCVAMIERARNIGVDEVACLIDFGVPAQQVLDSLPSLDRLRMMTSGALEHAQDTLPALMARHSVTHLQCTPTMAQMLAQDWSMRTALGGLARMMVGGEAFPPALAHELAGVVGGRVMNMYGPTETTIWSSVYELEGEEASVPLGQPLVNQNICIVDSQLRPLPPGIPGELMIGGKGVVRGYLHQPELTAERFVDHPFVPGERGYRTGDLAVLQGDGRLEFLGRLDHQVKVRGYRIELGEIEAVLASAPGVEQAVVVVREDVPGDLRLIGYYVPKRSASVLEAAALIDHLRAYLPEFMIPAHFVALPALPLTPNGKIARNALPAPVVERSTRSDECFVAPAAGVEEQIATIWRDVLKIQHVGKRDNFFDLGGHSLLAVQVHRSLKASFEKPISITDIFRFPTIETLSAHIESEGNDDTAVRQGGLRAQSRLAAMQRRRGFVHAGGGEGK